jgi:putative DNA primase/helicase
MWMLKGSGQNGKGVFIKVISHIFGEYAFTVPKNIIIKARGGGETHPTNLATLDGRRFVNLPELENGNGDLDIAAFKTLTGGDTIAARGMNKDFSNLTPTWTFFAEMNKFLRFSDISFPIRRRIRLIDFPNTSTQIDPALYSKLISEASGILNWVLEGALEYFRNGALQRANIPAAVLKATEEMWVDLDVFANWLRANCKLEPVETQSTILYNNYRKWLSDNGHHDQSSHSFGSKLRENGFSKRDSSGKTLYSGIRLSTPVEHSYRSTNEDAELATSAESFEPEAEIPTLDPSNVCKPKRRLIL